MTEKEPIKDYVKRLEDTINLWGSLFHDDIEKRVKRETRAKEKSLKKANNKLTRSQIGMLRRDIKNKRRPNRKPKKDPLCWYAIIAFICLISLPLIIPLTIILTNYGLLPIWATYLWCIGQTVLGITGHQLLY